MMKEIYDIVKAYDAAQKTGQQTALATVVKVEGSSYRRPGARMLVTEDGMLTGAISGGCLEGDALRKALLVMQQQKPLLVTYDTTDEEDAKLGVQLGCNGIVHILIEPVKQAAGNAVDLLREIAENRQDAILTTLFSLRDKKSETAGTYALLTETTTQKKVLPEELLRDMKYALQSKTSHVATYSETEALIDYVPPAISLLVFGAGNDVIPLAAMASVLGWQVTIVDGRHHYATAARFPSAKQVLVAKPADALTSVPVDENTAAVLMTHNYNYDVAMLQQLLPLALPYVGTLGPKSKLQRMLDELEENGVRITDEMKKKLYGPTGLDIGAETAEEIALSILSEIKMAMDGRSGLSLRKKETTIHADS